MNVYKYGLISIVMIALGAGTAQATRCGDDVEGSRVACDCGDTVVSNTRLQIDDPIVMRRCESNGLLIRAHADAASITLDLNGHSIAGSGAGTGIMVLRGGSEGANVVGGTHGALGQVLGFRNGVSARGKDVLASLSNLQVEANTKTGVAIDTDGATLTNIITVSNGGDGARLGGRALDVSGLDSRTNGGTGIVISGRDHEIRGRSADNAQADVSQHGGRAIRSSEVAQ